MQTEHSHARPVGRLVASGLAAVGVWSTFGLIDLIDGESNQLARIALLPPWWSLGALVLIFAAVAIATDRAGRRADLVLPLCALGLLAVPYLPWLPDRVPALRAAAGPGRNLLWLVVLWAIALPGLARLRFRAGIAFSQTLVLVASAIIFGTVAWRLIATPLYPSGDEPHYMVIIQSLLRDGDLKIENNHQRRDYAPYFGGVLRPDYLTRGVDRQIYSIHPIGLPVLALPAFAAGGYPAVVAMLVLMAALAAALLWRWALEITGSPAAATFGWAAAALTSPYLFNSFTVFPEIPAAFAVMVALAWRSGSTATSVMLLRGVALGALPWLSTKYAPMAAVVTIVLLLRMAWSVRAVAALLTPMAIALAGWFAHFFWIWGTFSPSAPYGSAQATTLATLARGGPGLLFDQEYGVIAYAPVLVLAFAGLFRMMRSGAGEARRALELLLAFGALLGTVGAFYLWWGGAASPGRPLASGVLLLGVPIATLFASTASRPSARALCHILLASSLAVSCAAAIAQDGTLLGNNRDGEAALLAWLSPTWPVSSGFPSFVVGSLTGAIARTVAWLALGAGIASLVGRCWPDRFGAAALGTLVLGFVGAVALLTVTQSGTALPPPDLRARTSVPLLDAFDTRFRPTMVLYDPLSRIASQDLLSRVSLTARRGLRTARQPLELLWDARFALPAGEYRVQVTRSAAPTRSDRLGLQIGRIGAPLEQWDVTGPVWEHRLLLPIDAQFVGFRPPPELAKSDGELKITPVRVVNQWERVGRPPVLSATRYGAVAAYFHDELIVGEPNGFWTQGRTTTQVTFATDTASPIINVVVHCGPVPNRVTLAVPGWSETLVLEPGSTRPAAIPAVEQSGLGVRVAPLDVSVEDGFVPADFDRATKDVRLLGCWVDIPRG